MGTIMTNGLSQLPEELNADGNAAMNTLLQLAGAVGTAVISTIVATAQAAEPTNIAHATMLGSRHGFFCAYCQRRAHPLLLLKGVRSY